MRTTKTTSTVINVAGGTGVVYIPQDSGKLNMTPALKFSSYLKSFTDRDCPISRVSETHQAIGEWLADFDPDSDYLLLTGDPVLMAMCVSWLTRCFKYFTLLKWDRQCREYIPVRVVV